ncbi:hypothetical protein CcI156_22170 [Frankia sp. CcI156]|nr:hypothetical protein CcI6DRAFT_04536 [Frankia sp. CcI6]EYT90432.1 hypothetical protein ThrDRAFT_03948 [Frankia casuarinae]ONH22076.1 hypothetical protein CcI156_22170 [Frankia sp. CcI156]
MGNATDHLDEAARRLRAAPAGPIRLGIGGRSIGCVADVDGVRRWLRVVAVPESDVHPLVWTGTATAHALPRSVRRPAMQGGTEWYTGGTRIRAEVIDYIEEKVCSDTEVLRTELDLTAGWWRSLRASLDALAAQPTERVPRTQEQLRRVLVRLFGPSIDPTVGTWVTAHGDLRWSNITRRTPYLLDWEFWGAAPAGADAATLYCTSLLVPTVADQVYDQFGDVLTSRDGRLSQLCVAVQLLRHADHGDLGDPLRKLIDGILPTLTN